MQHLFFFAMKKKWTDKLTNGNSKFLVNFLPALYLVCFSLVPRTPMVGWWIWRVVPLYWGKFGEEKERGDFSVMVGAGCAQNDIRGVSSQYNVVHSLLLCWTSSCKRLHYLCLSWSSLTCWQAAVFVVFAFLSFFGVICSMSAVAVVVVHQYCCIHVWFAQPHSHSLLRLHWGTPLDSIHWFWFLLFSHSPYMLTLTLLPVKNHLLDIFLFVSSTVRCFFLYLPHRRNHTRQRWYLWTTVALISFLESSRLW